MTFTILVTLLLTAQNVGRTQPADAEIISKYITSLLRDHSPGIGERYAGSYAELTGKTSRHAHDPFRGYRFVVADLYYSHWALDDGRVKMLLVLETRSGRVVGHCWAPWYAGHSESFADLLRRQEPSSDEGATDVVRTLAEAIVATSADFSVGDVTREGSDIVAPLIQGGKPWRYLRVTYDRRRGFARLRMINPVTGENDSAIAFEDVQNE